MADRLSEEQLRDLAYAHRGEAVVGSGTPVEGRRIGQMVSVRLEADLIADLRDVANRRGKTVSDLLREGAARVIAADREPSQTVELSVIEVTVPPPRTQGTQPGHQFSSGTVRSWQDVPGRIVSA